MVLTVLWRLPVETRFGIVHGPQGGLCELGFSPFPLPPSSSGLFASRVPSGKIRCSSVGVYAVLRPLFHFVSLSAAA